jgi:hypothetical protein
VILVTITIIKEREKSLIGILAVGQVLFSSKMFEKKEKRLVYLLTNSFKSRTIEEITIS